MSWIFLTMRCLANCFREGKRSVGRDSRGWHILNFNLKRRCFKKLFPAEISSALVLPMFFGGEENWKTANWYTSWEDSCMLYVNMCMCIYVYIYMISSIDLHPRKITQNLKFSTIKQTAIIFETFILRVSMSYFSKVHIYTQYIYIYTVQRPATLARWYHPKDQLWKSLVG